MHIEIGDKKVILDSAQLEVFHHLSHLQKQLGKSGKNSFLSKIKNLFSKPSLPKSLYIYGKVGRGKSMLMRNFFENLPVKKKSYFHFNSFMQEAHKELHKLRQAKSHHDQDLVSLATKKIIGDSKLVCFDEMQVEDVADAMILRSVFSYFLNSKITVVTTSNCHPLELYENGLQRDLFLKFVKEVLLPNFLVLNLDGKIDYRLQFAGLKQHYFYPVNSQNKKEVMAIWEKVTDGAKTQKREIEILGRKILVKKSYKNIALFDFAELCVEDLGVADYQAITKEFSLVFLLNVPVLKPEDRNEAKRLIWLIDEIYEKKVQLIVLAEAAPEKIYEEGIGVKAFKRTVSRLNELANVPDRHLFQAYQPGQD
ncbi:MAG: family ATPase [Rickettsiaceae bacterium]|jgi:cell division protein ZapE|nr:family ATPase [Rickettsiaceae bacterium]